MINVSDVSDEEVVDDGPLQFSDVEPYLQKTVQTDDPNLSEYLDKLRIQAAHNRVHRVNINYKKLREVWPQGTPIDFFVALEMFANLTDIELRGELTNPKNIQKIVNEVENRRKGTPSTHQLIKQSRFFSLMEDIESDASESNESDDYSAEDNNYASNARKYSHWTDEEMTRFINILKTGSKKLTWSMIAQQFPNHDSKQCHSYYYRLKKEKKINFLFIPKKDTNETRFQASSPGKPQHRSHQKETEGKKSSKFKDTKALVLLCGSQKAIVGPLTKRMKDIAIQNPLSKYNDSITGQPLFIPAISPYGTVLNYDTWMMIMDKDQIDPSVQRLVYSKSDIKIITLENFEQYKSRIRHLPDFEESNNQDDVSE